MHASSTCSTARICPLSCMPITISGHANDLLDRGAGAARLQGNAYGHGLVIAARAFMEGGFQELGVGDVREALVLRGAGLAQPLHVCYQPDLHSAAAIAAAPDLQARVVLSPRSCMRLPLRRPGLALGRAAAPLVAGDLLHAKRRWRMMSGRGTCVPQARLRTQVYVEDLRFVGALCRAGLAHNRTAQPLPVHISVSTGAVSPWRPLH